MMRRTEKVYRTKRKDSPKRKPWSRLRELALNYNKGLLAIYAETPERQFRASNLTTMIILAMVLIGVLLILFTFGSSKLLDPHAVRLFTAVFSVILVLFSICLFLVQRGQLNVARMIVVSTAIVAVLVAISITGGFPYSVASVAIFIPIVISYCIYGGKTSHMITAGLTLFLLVQWHSIANLGVTYPDFTSESSPDFNMAVSLITTLVIACLALGGFDESNRKYIHRANAAMVSKTNFLANTSHEIRTPMNGILGLTEVMMRTTELDQDQKIYMEAIHKSGKALMTIINDILDYSRLDAGYVELFEEPFNFKSLSDELCTLMAINAAEKNVVVTCDYPEDAPERFIGDIGRIRQIMINLLANAVKFTENGRVTIRFMIERDPLNGRVRVEVQDTGIGIPAKKLPTIFERFTQAESGTTQKYGGTGLGLSIAHKLVDLMDGRIGVWSEEHVGSTFWFELRLPLANPTLDQASMPVAPEDAPERAHLNLPGQADNVHNIPVSIDKKVLLISANPDLIKSYGDMLRKHDYRVFHSAMVTDVDYWLRGQTREMNALPVVLVDGDYAVSDLVDLKRRISESGQFIHVIGIATQQRNGYNPVFDSLQTIVRQPQQVIDHLQKPDSIIHYT